MGSKCYVVSICTDSSFYIPNAEHIERNDDLMLVEDDKQASIEAMNDGIKLITGMPGVPDAVYIDTPHNRECIEANLANYTEYLIHGLDNMDRISVCNLVEGEKVFVMYDKSDSTWMPEVKEINRDGIETVTADKVGNSILVDVNGARLSEIAHYLEVEAIEIYDIPDFVTSRWN